MTRTSPTIDAKPAFCDVDDYSVLSKTRKQDAKALHALAITRACNQAINVRDNEGGILGQ